MLIINVTLSFSYIQGVQPLPSNIHFLYSHVLHVELYSDQQSLRTNGAVSYGGVSYMCGEDGNHSYAVFFRFYSQSL